MTRGEKDYTRSTTTKIAAARIDLDLPVILIDRFDSANLRWVGAGTGTDWNVQLEPESAYEGDLGLAMRTRLTGQTGLDQVDASRYAFTTPTTKLSFSSLFRINQSHLTIRRIEWINEGRAGDQIWRAGLQYSAATQTWEYLDDAGMWHTFLTGIDQGLHAWNRVAFEIDIENFQYLKATIDELSINMQGIPIQHSTLAGWRHLRLEIALQSQIVGTRADVSIDNYIVKELGY